MGAELKRILAVALLFTVSVPIILAAFILSNVSTQPSENERCAAFVAGEAERPLFAPPWGEGASETLIRMSVAGTRYAIPGDYFRHPPYGCDMPEPGFLLRVIIHDLAPFASNLERAQSSYDTMNILLQQMPRISSVSGEPIFYMRNVLRGADANSHRDRIGNSSDWDGIHHAKHDLDTDVYFDLDEQDEPILIIRCGLYGKIGDDHPGTVPFPVCGMYYPRGGAFIKLSFSRDHLHRWREIKSDTEAFLDGFVVNQTEPNTR